MSILDEYYSILDYLKKSLEIASDVPLSKRNPLLIEVLKSEIDDVEFAIACLERNNSDLRCYRPRRSTLMTRADLYIGL